MDVYLQPLVEELQILWEGIQVFDMSKPAHTWRTTTIRGILMWTMHDFPGYGECTGLAVSGYHACPICGPNLQARYSKSLKKMVYEGHVRYLPEGHIMRDGYLGRPPQERWSPSMQYDAWMLSNEKNRPSGMNRLSILHQLPYWQDLLITSLLDPMHIFKNVGQTIWDHFIGIKDKGGWREDLKECHKEHLLHRGPIWSFTKQEDEQVKSVIKSFRTPTGHMHCLKGAFTHDNRLSGLKTHDWHKMLQYILPIAIKGCLTPEIRQVIYKISRLVRWISQKEISHESIEENRVNAIEAVCLLEKNFPSSAMTIQVHLLVHIVDEVALAGIVHARWMFFLERFMKTLKGFVRQRARPEASMAEGWLVQEAMAHIAEFLGRNDPLGAPQAWSNKEDDRVSSEVPQGNGNDYVMNEAFRDKVNRFCMLNHPAMDKWRQRYDEERHNVEQERTAYRATCGQHIGLSNIQYPTHLKMLPKYMSLNWLDDALQNAARQGEQVTEEEREFARVEM